MYVGGRALVKGLQWTHPFLWDPGTHSLARGLNFESVIHLIISSKSTVNWSKVLKKEHSRKLPPWQGWFRVVCGRIQWWWKGVVQSLLRIGGERWNLPKITNYWWGAWWQSRVWQSRVWQSSDNPVAIQWQSRVWEATNSNERQKEREAWHASETLLPLLFWQKYKFKSVFNCQYQCT